MAQRMAGGIDSFPLMAIPQVLQKAVRTIAIVMLLIACANAFGWMLAFLEVPKQATQFLLSLSTDRNVILLIVNILLLVLGCIIDMAPIILTVTPILLPVMQQIGVDPVDFGVIMMINLGIGLVTPPVGSALFAGCAIGKIPIEGVLKPLALLLPFMVGTLLLVSYVPALTLWVPNLVMPVR
ncbi:MAG: TRAP transporter large permease subunit [Candidatus Methylomirabilales bacterium]